MGPRTTWALVLVQITLAVTACAPSSDTSEREPARVARVVDGDTLVLDDDRRVRLIGIDTPETVDPRRPVECFGREASARLHELLPTGTEITLEFDVDRTDRYDRTLAYVRRVDDGEFVNVSLARDGYAEQLTVPPNVRYADDIAGAVRHAREESRGLWAEGACDLSEQPSS